MLLIMKDDPDDPTFDPKLSKKRRRSKQLNANSVKRVIMLAVAQNVPENYHNLKVLWDAAKLGDLKTCLSCDCKVANITSGIQVKVQFNHNKGLNVSSNHNMN